MTASVVPAKNQSPIRTYSTIDSSTRSIGVAISTSRPGVEQVTGRRRLRREQKQRQPDGQERRR